MSATDEVYQRVHPEVDSWVAAVHATADNRARLGSGVVIDNRRVLTCAHVVMSDEAVRREI